MLFYLFSILSQRILIHCNILEGETEKRKKERVGEEKGDRYERGGTMPKFCNCKSFKVRTMQILSIVTINFFILNSGTYLKQNN